MLLLFKVTCLETPASREKHRWTVLTHLLECMQKETESSTGVLLAF